MSISDRRKQQKIRQRVIQRDGLICCFCDKELTEEELTLDHLVPVSFRGAFIYSNLSVACSPCNNKRGNRNFFEVAAAHKFNLAKTQRYFNFFKASSEIKILSLLLSKYSESSKVPQELAASAYKQLLKDYKAYHPIDFDLMLKSWKQICRPIQFSFKKASTKQALKRAITHLITHIEGELK